MTLRISTAGLHAQGLAALLQRQQDLARTQQQLVTGNKLTRAAEDPAGAAQAQQLDHAVAALAQFDRSAGLLEHRLRMQEQALGDGNNLITRARELAIQANSAALSQQDRALVATELRQLRAGMLALANRADGDGRYLFAGQRDGVVPFAESGGRVAYAGDDGRNLVDVAPDLALADTDAGSTVFLRMRTGNGELRGSAAAGNSGNAVLQSASVADHGAWPGTALRLAFTAPDSYEVRDAGGTVVAAGSYASGDTITAGGVQVRLTGTAAAGDAFVLEPAPAQDIFATLKSLADALEAPAGTAAERARLGNAIGGAIADLGSAQDHFLGLRAGTGARLAALDATADTRLAQDESLRSSLSRLRDVDYAQAASQLSLQMTAIEAAQRTMLRVQTLSLFDKLG